MKRKLKINLETYIRLFGEDEYTSLSKRYVKIVPHVSKIPIEKSSLRTEKKISDHKIAKKRTNEGKITKPQILKKSQKSKEKTTQERINRKLRLEDFIKPTQKRKIKEDSIRETVTEKPLKSVIKQIIQSKNKSTTSKPQIQEKYKTSRDSTKLKPKQAKETVPTAPTEHSARPTQESLAKYLAGLTQTSIIKYLTGHIKVPVIEYSGRSYQPANVKNSAGPLQSPRTEYTNKCIQEPGTEDSARPIQVPKSQEYENLTIQAPRSPVTKCSSSSQTINTEPLDSLPQTPSIENKSTQTISNNEKNTEGEYKSSGRRRERTKNRMTPTTSSLDQSKKHPHITKCSDSTRINQHQDILGSGLKNDTVPVLKSSEIINNKSQLETLIPISQVTNIVLDSDEETQLIKETTLPNETTDSVKCDEKAVLEFVKLTTELGDKILNNQFLDPFEKFVELSNFSNRLHKIWDKVLKLVSRPCIHNCINVENFLINKNVNESDDVLTIIEDNLEVMLFNTKKLKTQNNEVALIPEPTHPVDETAVRELINGSQKNSNTFSTTQISNQITDQELTNFNNASDTSTNTKSNQSAKIFNEESLVLQKFSLHRNNNLFAQIIIYPHSPDPEESPVPEKANCLELYRTSHQIVDDKLVEQSTIKIGSSDNQKTTKAFDFAMYTINQNAVKERTTKSTLRKLRLEQLKLQYENEKGDKTSSSSSSSISSYTDYANDDEYSEFVSFTPEDNIPQSSNRVKKKPDEKVIILENIMLKAPDPK